MRTIVFHQSAFEQYNEWALRDRKALHLAEGITADYDHDGRLAGLEVLDAVKRFGDESTFKQVVIEGLGPAVPLAG